MAESIRRDQETQDPTPATSQPRRITIRRLGKKEATGPLLPSGAQGN